MISYIKILVFIHTVNTGTVAKRSIIIRCEQQSTMLPKILKGVFLGFEVVMLSFWKKYIKIFGNQSQIAPSSYTKINLDLSQIQFNNDMRVYFNEKQLYLKIRVTDLKLVKL